MEGTSTNILDNEFAEYEPSRIRLLSEREQEAGPVTAPALLPDYTLAPANGRS